MTGQTYDRDVRIPISFTSTMRMLLAQDEDTTVLGDKIDSKLRGYIRQGIFLPIIDMMVNPNTIQWTQPKRIVAQDTFTGTAFFHFSNSKGQNNDILTLTFRGSTGNIDPKGGTETFGTGSANKWLIWHNLYQLSREEMKLLNGQENLVTIHYSSPLFPGTNLDIISLDGYFMDVVKFEESAAKPNSRDYEFTFSVISTSPPIEDMGGFLSHVAGARGV